MKQNYQKIYKRIKAYQQIIIARHIGPDPDAIASQISLREAIKLTFPKKQVFAVGTGVAKFRCYGLLDKVPEIDFAKTLLIVLDLPNLERIDGVNPILFKEVIKIDHHPYEEKMGELEIVDDQASSTSQIIAELLLNTKFKINQQIAENLYLGIVSDSDRFLLSYTTPKTFRVVADLIEKTNIDFTSLYKLIYDRPIEEIRFQGFIANNLIVTPNGLAYINISNEDIEKYKVDPATASNMVNDFIFIKDIVAWTFITYDERHELYKINVRSRGPIINEIANKYNGGGHKFASGIRTTDKREIENIIKDLDEACQKYKEGN